MKSFQQTQLAFAAHLRDPQHNPPPPAIEDRRMGIYRDLIFNNIESFIAGAFPVLRSITSDSDWQLLVRDFVVQHRAQTPYFLEISQEFLAYLMQTRGLRETDPAFMIELAHYEWVELALDVAEAEWGIAKPLLASLMDTCIQVSPLVMNLCYSYPVHKIGPGFMPTEVVPTYLVVYRNRADQVKFIEANALTHRLLHLLQTSPNQPLWAHLQLLAQELQHPNPQLLNQQAETLLQEWYGLGLVGAI